jgi:hypothetical protein
MKKIITVLACMPMFSVVSPSLRSQTVSPDQWESFIVANKGVLVSDTFRMQQFENRISDNWSYTTSGENTIIDASASGISKTSGGKLLKIELGSDLFFSGFYSPQHQSITGGVARGGKNLSKGENLNIVLYEDEKTDSIVLVKVTSDNFGLDMLHTNIRNRPLRSLSLNVEPPASNTKNGYYCIDSVYLLGNIPRYSLFRGKSSWNDTTAWSDLPAERHRHALVKGDVSITADTHCDLVDLSGILKIEKEKLFSLEEMNVYEASSRIQNEGEFLLNGKMNLSRTFPEKGVWYFISFPFDVYADGIDPDFTLKDEAPNDGGNFIYALSYNGELRNNGQTTRSNWDVLDEAAGSGNVPVFKKNKGYLLAVDAQASKTTIRFTSRAGAIPATFGRSGQIDIDIPYTVDENSGDGGWYLCGNPLPASLHIRELEHSDLDGYVYVFNGENYTAIPLDGNYTLPPYSAFFLKARQSVTLSVGLTEDEEKSTALSGMLPLRVIKYEPTANAPTNNIPLFDNRYYQMGRTAFLITKAPENGSTTIFDAAGRQVSTTRFAAGESGQIALPEQPGFYVLLLQTQNGRKEYKFIR